MMELESSGNAVAWLCFTIMVMLSVATVIEEFFVQCVLSCGNPAEVTSLRSLFWLRVLFGRTRARIVGAVTETRLPKPLRAPAYRLYSMACGCCLDEVDEPLEAYPSLADFFCRSLKDGARHIACLPRGLVSPVDGRILTVGIIDRPSARVEQVKGTTYSVRGLLGCDPVKTKSPASVVRYAVIYLSPGDYHQVHSPCDCRIDEGKHFPGELLPVGGGILKWMHDVFCVNERVVLSGSWLFGALYTVAVGAANVGRIYLNFDPTLATNNSGERTIHCGGSAVAREYPEGIHLGAGEALGGFRLGSTVVLVFESPADFSWIAQPGDRVHVGQPLGQALGAALPS